MCIGAHEVEPFDRLCIERKIERPSVALAGIFEHESAGIGRCTGGINGTIVYAVETSEAAHVGNAPVCNLNSVDSFVINTFGCHSEGERNRHLIVYSQRGFPYLWHLELRVDGSNLRGDRTRFGRDGRWENLLSAGIGHVDELIVEGFDGSFAVGIGHQTAGKIVHRVTESATIARIELCLILHHAAVGGHVGEEHQG